MGAVCAASSAPRAVRDAAPSTAGRGRSSAPCRLELSSVPELLQVDLRGVGLRQTAQTGTRIVTAIDVLQRNGPVLSGVEEGFWRCELDLRLADDGLEGLEITVLIRSDPLEGGVEHRLSHRIGISAALDGFVHRFLAGGPLNEQP